MNLHTIRYGIEDGVAVVTLDRPDRLNAWTARMEHEYTWALTQAATDDGVRVVVITGAGRGFCVGADAKALDRISEAGDYDKAAPPPPEDIPELATGEVFLLASRMPKPVIAAVNGPAAGVGFVLMCGADVRFAAEGAKLTTSFARLGLPAEHGVSWLLVRLVGPGRAADLLLSSRVMLAEEGVGMGLVNAVFSADELLPQTMAYAKRIASELSPSALAVIKRQVYDDLERDRRAALEWSVAEMKRMVKEPDFVEGAAALSERRPPRFGPLSS
ncbi:MAG: enoyl-CoA hydratase/isomerase family protein [Acidimicrobiia bacterium]|nr:enoyl-CoA hydratase/isomerase family protein [Acidimicrobiia bacterium]